MPPHPKYELKLLSLCLLTCVCLMILSGCTTQPQKTPNVPYQENLKTKCPETLPRLEGNTGQLLAKALLIYQDIYPVCAARHNALVNEINKRERELNNE